MTRLTLERHMILYDACERGEASALLDLPIELWPWPLTPAMEQTLRTLEPHQKQILLAMMQAGAVPGGCYD